MAIKKSELYSSLWQSCDELRGGMDASQYKDYVLVLLFVKYISDKYADRSDPFAPVKLPEGASFKDMIALKGKPTIGDDINKKIIEPIAKANKLADMPDFNDVSKLGEGKEKVDRLTNLIAIFENKALDFSSNRADGDDILGDAYEYLMRHFATESGKSKGQFYTPAEVSRILAEIIGIKAATTSASTSVYDPTCGSGSLLLKVGHEAQSGATLFGQEKDAATSGLARMNMILHDNPSAEIKQGNTLANPLFLNTQGQLQTFDYVVANPPFSDKRWSTGVDVEEDPHTRFDAHGVPPDKNGDYAYLLHIIRSLKSQGKGACILPHGVLFRGNAEADIRTSLIRQGLIKGIIGLPANLFYGTGIPACIILIDKENAQNRKGIFMVDAGKGFIKDGNKNRLRDMDIHKIVDVFTKQTDIKGYSRMVAFAEIEKNDFNLNIPRYIDSSEAEDLQDIEAHLLGGIPKTDIDALDDYWRVFPSLKNTLFADTERDNYLNLLVEKEAIKTAIYQHSEFVQFIGEMNQLFKQWQTQSTTILKALEPNFHPKELIITLSESLLAVYTDKALLSKYDVYQHIMDYWFEVMQDDTYLIAADGWKAETYRIIEEKKNKAGQVIKTTDKGWTCDLIPKCLIINRYFSEEQQAIDDQKVELENIQTELTELEESNGGDGDVLSSVGNKGEANIVLAEYIDLIWACFDKESFTVYKTNTIQLESEILQLSVLKNGDLLRLLINSKGNITQKVVKDRLKLVIGTDSEEEQGLNAYLKVEQSLKTIKKTIKELRDKALSYIDELIEKQDEYEYLQEIIIIRQYLQLTESISNITKEIKEAEAKLDAQLLEFYPSLTVEQIKQLVVDDKWMVTMDKAVHSEMDRISQRLTQRIKELAERYETPMPQQSQNVQILEQAVQVHLAKMGFSF